MRIQILRRAQDSNVFDDCFAVAIVDAEITSYGTIVPKERAEVFNAISSSVMHGSEMKPLADDEISGDASNAFLMMNPLLTKMLGQVGQGLEFVCFNGRNSKGQKIVYPAKQGNFTVKYGNSEYRWRLPLGSLLPDKYDNETGEKFSGNYIFIPFTGNKLAEKPSAK